VPLAIAGTLILARLCEDGFRQIDRGLIEFGRAYGATDQSDYRQILSCRSPCRAIISSVTTVMVSLIGFSAMAGAVGGGGLGDLAIRYGYQRYELELLVYIVIILVVMVQSVQMSWRLARRKIKEVTNE
jgi:D-methionine transport system permease protein